ncbi:type IV pilus twitching motility protein PilT [Microbacterium sp. STN6]|uniref:type IV pilus twitching motility protein PilT n=1 Tax=Microbacterium sp. STN6 TaxID=2995588 RepID=UPI00226100E2|nr:type IV pilus twitching motility protein PilT [Microbacterium sp. STN6]MCX7523184.1 type IV pilus twitching motility protein PilT [Microbacterium sp. STN6]
MDDPIYEIPVTPPAQGSRRWSLGEEAEEAARRSLATPATDAAQPPASPVHAPADAPSYTQPTQLMPTVGDDAGPSFAAPRAAVQAAMPSMQAPVPAAGQPSVAQQAAAPQAALAATPPVQQAAAPAAQPSAAAPPVRPAAAAASAGAEERRASRQAADPELIAALQEVVYSRASDLHVTANAAPMMRVDGGLRAVPGGQPWDRERVASALRTLISPEQQKQFEREYELDFAYTVSANARFRVNYYKQRDAIGAAFRLIPTEIRQLKELGVPEGIGKFAGLPRGLVLVTGPTGSGKSTTLAALIDLVNSTRTDHIVTVEDPIEFLHPHKKSIVNQREVGHDTHSFAAALKHVLRQDPDVILIGELRDLETISVALTAAETGHLVFATLHTQDAPQTIDRMIDVFPPHQQGQVRAQLAATLQGVVCQTLVARATGEGRAVATEVMMTTPGIANLIREGKTYQIASAMQAGRELGMHTMDQHLAELVNTGKVTHAAALEKVHDPGGFDRLVDRVDSPTEASARALAVGGIDFGDSFSGGVH